MKKALLLLALVSCDAGKPPIAVEVLPLTRVTGVSGEPGFQTTAAAATIPEGRWKRITLRYELTATCDGEPPTGDNWPEKCDPYDRISRVTIDGALVVFAAATPFGGSVRWESDVTDYAPALAGTHEWEVYISTGADPNGTAAGTQAGWDVRLEVVLEPGDPPREVVGVTPALMKARFAAGDSALSAEIAPPEGATGARVELFTSGHGAVGNFACDEFCKKQNVVSLAGSAVIEAVPWTDCSDRCTPVPSDKTFTCMGRTFDYTCAENPTSCPASAVLDRAGWCPGSPIAPISAEIAATAGTLTFDVPQRQGWWQVGANVIWTR